MSTCPNSCAPNLSASILNTSLIPTFLQGMTQAQQCAFIEASTKAAQIFRYQALTFLKSITNAQRQQALKRFVCPFVVPWSVSNPPLNINQQSQINYLNFFMGSRTGFAFILGKVQAFFRKQRRCNQLRANGQAVCVC